MWETYTFKDQTAGYLTNWADTNLSFLTVHGAGHEVLLLCNAPSSL